MKNVMGIINNAQKEDFMRELTEIRSLASIPFGCRYRLIDFPLSNLVNSGVTNVGILLENKYRSLMDHIGPGKVWDLDRKRDGLFILPPAQVYGDNRFYKGDIENFYSNIDYIHRSSQDYVIISTPYMVCNLDYREIVKAHKESGADITLVYKQMPTLEDKSTCSILKTDKNNRVTELKVNSDLKNYDKVSLNKFVMKKELLLEIIDECVSMGRWDFIKDGIIGNLDRLNIHGYPFSGALGIINSIKSYYKFNLKLLNPEIWKDIFMTKTIYTKSKDEPPTQFTAVSKVKNVLAANGCIVKGHVENSLLFRGVKIEKGAVVKNSILMQKSTVGQNSRLNNVILDKNVVITPEKVLRGEENFPTIIKKNVVI